MKNRFDMVKPHVRIFTCELRRRVVSAIQGLGCLCKKSVLSVLIALPLMAISGEEWIYDTTSHITPKPSMVQGSVCFLSAQSRGIDISEKSSIETLLLTFGISNSIRIRFTEPQGAILIVR